MASANGRIGSALALINAESKFRRISGYSQLWVLTNEVKALLNYEPTGAL